MHRVNKVTGHVAPESHNVNAQQVYYSPDEKAGDDDVVICAAVRTALARSKKGGFAKTAPEELLAAVLREAVVRAGAKGEMVGDIVVGNVLQGGAGAITSRLGQLLGGISADVPLVAVNRQCSSGLQAIANIAGAIKQGSIDCGIGAGVEQMSMWGFDAPVNLDKMSDAIIDNPKARDCMIPMGITSENVAREFGISREKQDALAAASHAKAAKAQATGLFKDEIVPVKNAQGKMISQDEGIRAGTTAESLSKLKAAFQVGGSTTAGNSSQTTDGAAATFLARRSFAKEKGLTIIGRLVSVAVKGCDPYIMGIGPAVAIPLALKQAGLGVNDIDIYEINEAFASQATYCIEKLGIDMKKVNPKGGAIALGHPLGATGARMMATLLPELKRQGKKTGVISMCIGTGMGMAAVVERE